jgi:hypothetical protein
MSDETRVARVGSTRLNVGSNDRELVLIEEMIEVHRHAPACAGARGLSAAHVQSVMGDNEHMGIIREFYKGQGGGASSN